MKRLLAALLVLSLAASSMVLSSCRDKDSSENNENSKASSPKNETSKESIDYYDKIGDIASKVKEEYFDKLNSSSASNGDINNETEDQPESVSPEISVEYPTDESVEN